ncbi:MAG: sodium-dependent transporter [Ectothiorhodospiraceae bacterium]|jgi:NSS family neurotransmitter:Na+ symporter|nr:sodium-dependent transporter [Ectothiorhodospiraceae bacterium]
MRRTQSIHGQWSSRLVFVLAATGSAVGLGNIWKFPYIAGENGGGAFVLLYLVCIFAIGLPIMIAEIMLGRRGRQSPINTMSTLAREEGLTPAWSLLGWMGVVTGFLILSYYSVIAGWALAYVFHAVGGMFEGIGADEADGLFVDLISDPAQLMLWHTLFMLLTVVVVARGVRSGLERAVEVMVPGLVVILLALVGYAAVEGHFATGFQFLFSADFSRLNANAVLTAMGHAFFTLSLGMGAIMVYGSYLASRASIATTSFMVVIADTVVALLAGLAIFPIVFAAGLEPGQGPGLIFKTLPIAFGQMPGGTFFGTLFFLLLVFAAWTSSISLVEPAVAWLVENRGMQRAWASIVTGALAWVLGVGTVLSFNLWSEGVIFGRTVFDILDYATSNVLLPLGGLLITLFAGWLMSRASVSEELALGNTVLFRLWYFLVRFVAPVGIFIVFLNVLGIL